jgi:hypothetical protein
MACSVLELESLSTTNVNHAATIAATLLLVLLLGESLAPGHNQIIVCSVGVVVGDIGVANVFAVVTFR